jgi:hypothetical protein
MICSSVLGAGSGARRMTGMLVHNPIPTLSVP